MKIYATRFHKTPTEILQQFKGTDYWVKVREWHQQEYIRVINIINADDIESCIIICNWVSTRNLFNAHARDIYTEGILDTTAKIYMKSIEVIQPLDLLSTEEIVEIYTGNK